MQRIATLAAVLAIALVPVLGGTALAHGDKEVTVTPLGPRAGETITVKGGGLGENRDIEIRLIGQGVDIGLGEVQAEDDGDFSDQFQVPAQVKSGIYLIRAVGEDTVETQVTIAPSAAGTSAQGAITQPSTAGVMALEGTDTARQRPFGEAAILVAIFGAIAALGLLFALTAHRGRASRPA